MLTAVLDFLTGGLVDKVLELGKAYVGKQISEAEFKSRVQIAADEARARVEGAWAATAAETARATQGALKASPVLQRAWSAVLFLEVTVLVWYQIGAPAFLVITGTPWPSAGVTLEWAYLLVAAQLGAGPLVFRRAS